mgnify:CR=1 FL=1
MTADLFLPFHLETAGARGRLVRLGPALDTILSAHDYPRPVAMLLAEALALCGALASSLKFDGVVTLQASGHGAVRTLVADITTDGALRGYAAFDEAAVALLDPGKAEGTPVSALLEHGHLAFTVDQGSDAKRFQGIVELEGTTLAECLHAYFRQSEQVDTAFRVALAPPAGDRGWQSGVLSLQRLPGDGNGSAEETPEEAWRTAVVLMSSVTDRELLELPPEQTAHRLFHEAGLRLHDPRGLFARCRCAREGVESALKSFGREELSDMVEPDGRIHVTCQFCNTEYLFHPDEVEAPE